MLMFDYSRSINKNILELPITFLAQEIGEGDVRETGVFGLGSGVGQVFCFDYSKRRSISLYRG